MGTYSIDSITKYINFYEIIKQRNANYPFAIFSTDKEKEPGVHWWSFINIQPKNNLFLILMAQKVLNFLLWIKINKLLMNYYIT